jgi:hypothetical protein
MAAERQHLREKRAEIRWKSEPMDLLRAPEFVIGQPWRELDLTLPESLQH